jgi:hypothetical protein
VKSILQQITGILKPPVGQAAGVVSPGASAPPSPPAGHRGGGRRRQRWRSHRRRRCDRADERSS